MVVGLLGILKAGAAYVPMDPEYPARRLQLMVDDARVSHIVTQTALVPRLKPISAELLCVDASEPRDSGAQPHTLDDQKPQPHDLAYIIYTSGSSGRPKGVAIEHRSLVNYVHGVVDRLGLEPGWHYATVSTIAADLGNTMVFPSLCTGGCLHVLSRDRVTNPRRFAEYFEQHPIDCLKTTPSHLAALLDGSTPADVLPRERLILGGEAFPTVLAEQIQALAPTCRVFNHYGPTETTIGVSTYEAVGRPPTTVSGTVPIGRPLPNSRLYILDDRMEPTPVGVTGQLCIGGGGVAREYWNRASLTDEKFVPDPFHREPHALVYQTGDLARFLPCGDIEFLRRRDHQVKVRGYRVELGEIEAVVGQHPGVKAVAVTAEADPSGETRLVAYVASHGSATTLGENATMKLPNNVVVAHLNRSETEYLYREIFELQAYLRHGITIGAEDCVFDVGANVGLFSLFVNQICGARDVYSFEPNPVVFDVLQANMSRYYPDDVPPLLSSTRI